MAVLLLGGPALLGGCSSGSSASGTPCKVDKDCSQGTVCIGDTCGEKQCASFKDCDEGQVCETLAGASASVCTKAECGCATCGSCEAGQTCTRQSSPGGICLSDTVVGADATSGDVAGKVCSKKEDCETGEDCGADGRCQPESKLCTKDADCPDGTCGTDGNCQALPAKCPDTPCTAPKICNDQTGACVDPPTKGDLCKACGADSDCGGDKDLCSPLSSGAFCTLACAGDSDCPAGFKCFEVTTEGTQCVPFSFECTGCVVDGCPSGQICNFGNGKCQDARAICSPCQFDFECSGDGSSLCYKAGGSGAGVCAPACAGGTCADGNACTTAENGRKVCAHGGSTCCYGPNCAACASCPADKAQCLDGKCVQCLSDAHCLNGTAPCDTATNTCTGQPCPADKPFLKGDTCVECINSTHCTSGNCDPATNTCAAGGVCASCADPYPSCTELTPGQFTCVQCTPTDTSFCDVIGGVCDPKSFVCEGGTQPVGNCQKQGCPPNPSGGDPLICDPQSGACLDPSGSCDGVTTDCKAGDCLSLLDLFGGGGGGGIPLPAGQGIPGVCTCDPVNGDADCVSGSICLDPSNPIISGLLGAFGQILGNQPVCIDCGGGGGALGGLGSIFQLICPLLGGGGFPFPFP